MIEHIIRVLVLSAVVPAIIFPLLYAVRSPWRSTLVGRSLMQLAISLALTLGLIVFTTIFGRHYPGRELIRLVVYTLVVVSLWRQVIVLFMVQNQHQRELARAEADLLAQQELPRS